MLLIHFMLYTIIFLNEKSMYVLVFYGAQLCFFIVALFMYNNIYRNASRLLINNMFFDDDRICDADKAGYDAGSEAVFNSCGICGFQSGSAGHC